MSSLSLFVHWRYNRCQPKRSPFFIPVQDDDILSPALKMKPILPVSFF